MLVLSRKALSEHKHTNFTVWLTGEWQRANLQSVSSPRAGVLCGRVISHHPPPPASIMYFFPQRTHAPLAVSFRAGALIRPATGGDATARCVESEATGARGGGEGGIGEGELRAAHQ